MDAAEAEEAPKDGADQDGCRGCWQLELFRYHCCDNEHDEDVAQEHHIESNVVMVVFATLHLVAGQLPPDRHTRHAGAQDTLLGPVAVGSYVVSKPKFSAVLQSPPQHTWYASSAWEAARRHNMRMMAGNRGVLRMRSTCSAYRCMCVQRAPASRTALPISVAAFFLCRGACVCSFYKPSMRTLVAGATGA